MSCRRGCVLLAPASSRCRRSMRRSPTRCLQPPVNGCASCLSGSIPRHRRTFTARLRAVPASRVSRAGVGRPAELSARHIGHTDGPKREAAHDQFAAAFPGARMTLVGPALRRLTRRPVLGLTAIATLAIALGANVAIFSLLDTVGLRPLPFADAGRLVFIGSSVPTLPDLRGVSWPRFHYLESATRAYDSVAGFYENNFALTERGRAELVDGMRVSGGFFKVFRVSPLLGRTFSASEEGKGGAEVALL